MNHQTSLKTAVLFLVFNRPDTTEQVFETIRKARPPRLYVAADGPRADRAGDAEKVAKVREIATKVDWSCEVKTLFRKENLGCKYAVSGGINWFFEHEEHGIILEDDCLPDQSFFWFCEVMLKKYAANKKIWMVCGFNPRYPGLVGEKYFLSRNPSVWGWASWRDRWGEYKVEITDRDYRFLRSKQNNLPAYVIRHYAKAFSAVAKGEIDSWDYQLLHIVLKCNGSVVKAMPNLVSNIGIEGTHSTMVLPNHNVKKGNINNNNLILISEDDGYREDNWFYKKNFKHSVLKRINLILKRLFNICLKVTSK